MRAVPFCVRTLWGGTPSVVTAFRRPCLERVRGFRSGADARGRRCLPPVHARTRTPLPPEGGLASATDRRPFPAGAVRGRPMRQALQPGEPVVLGPVSAWPFRFPEADDPSLRLSAQLFPSRPANRPFGEAARSPAGAGALGGKDATAFLRHAPESRGRVFSGAAGSRRSALPRSERPEGCSARFGPVARSEGSVPEGWRPDVVSRNPPRRRNRCLAVGLGRRYRQLQVRNDLHRLGS